MKAELSLFFTGNLERLTAMDKCLQSFGYFHTKMAFSRGHLETNWFNNFLILLRVKQHVYGEHKLKFWIKNIHEFQNWRSVYEKRSIFWYIY